MKKGTAILTCSGCFSITGTDLSTNPVHRNVENEQTKCCNVNEIDGRAQDVSAQPAQRNENTKHDDRYPDQVYGDIERVLVGSRIAR